ncbi:MAG: L-histidine N(alpha)-methyltransferase [Stackebrandtia sp.]
MKPYVLIHCGYNEYTASLRSDARFGLSGQTPALPSRWCFDGRGRRLFARLAAGLQPQLFRAEADALTDHAAEFAELAGARHVVQLGPREALPPQVLADAVRETGRLTAVSNLDTPHAEVEEFGFGFGNVDVRHVVTDPAGPLPDLAESQRLIHCPIPGFATLDTNERQRLLLRLRRACEPGDHLLVAAPLPGVPGRHRDFFDDEAGLGAEFNRNVCNVINHTLDGDVTETAFDHVVGYVADDDRLELRLRARVGLRIVLRTLGFHVDLSTGAELRTLRLFGLSTRALTSELGRAGFGNVVLRHDPKEFTTLALAEALGD